MRQAREPLHVSDLTPAIRWLRTSRPGHVALLAGLVAAWLVLYRINESLWEVVLFGWLGLVPEQRLSETLRFFFYDSIKIALLLSGIIFLVTVLRSYLSVERTRALLAGRREGIGNVLAGLLGVITPFCSCSAVPAFIGFLAAGIPLGVTMSFLIASPMVNEVAIGLLFSLFGWRITLIYISSGLADRDPGGMGARPSAAGALGRILCLRDQTAWTGRGVFAGSVL